MSYLDLSVLCSCYFYLLIYLSPRNFYTLSDADSGTARFSQTLTVILGRQYELSYFQGLSGNSELEHPTSNCRASAQLNAIQVTPPVHPCGGNLPGSCKTYPQDVSGLVEMHWEEIKAITSSPIAETTLTITFECEAIPRPREFAYYMLDSITMTLL